MTAELQNSSAEHFSATSIEYHSDARNSLSHSEAECFNESPELYWGRYLTGIYPREETADLRFGQLFHSYVLEGITPAIVPPCDAILKTGKRKGNPCGANAIFSSGSLSFCGTHAPDDALEITDAASVDEWKTMQAMRSGIDRCKPARLLLARQRETEFSIRWTDEQTGIRCRCRLDIFSDILADLKTCRDASPKGFSSSALRFAYHRQDEWYKAGVNEFTKDMRRMVFIACQKTPPYTCACYELDEAFIALAAKENREILTKFAKAKQEGRWAAPTADEIVTLSAPRWANYESEWEL